MAKILFACYPESSIQKIILEKEFGHCVASVNILEWIEEELGKNHYDLLIIEPFLPVVGSLNGMDDYKRKCLATFERIMAKANHPLVIVCSTFAFCPPEYFLQKGASGVLSMPHEARALGELVQKVLSEKK